jgi:hypothetical protein
MVFALNTPYSSLFVLYRVSLCLFYAICVICQVTCLFSFSDQNVTFLYHIPFTRIGFAYFTPVCVIAVIFAQHSFDEAHIIVRSARPRTQHDYHHDTKVKPVTATAVIELLMMGGKTPETC